MQLDITQLEYLAKLSALELTPDLITKTQMALGQTIDILNHLSEIDVGDTEPLHYPLDILQTFSQPLREDFVLDINASQQAQAISQAPMTENGLYLVPKVIGE